MDKFFHSTFDFFSHALPGAFVAGSAYLIGQNVQSVKGLFKVANEASISIGVFLLLTGYVIGLAIYPLGRWVYKRRGEKAIEEGINRDPNKIKTPSPGLTISDKFILIRELSPANFKYVETWHMFCAMCHNLGIACLLVAAIMVFKIDWSSFFYGNEIWLGSIGVLLILYSVFIDRAITFSIWAANDLNASINKLELTGQAAKLSEKAERT